MVITTMYSCYCYEFENQCDGVEVVWITTESFWNTHGYFSDQERGKEFPLAIQHLLVNISGACFELRKPYTKQEFISLANLQGWKHVGV